MLQSVQVTATRTEQPSASVPAAITVVETDKVPIRGPGVNLTEKLTGVAGVLARDRQNYAQDVQISIRGFGARATFGIRGLRLYLDGMPATMPDGQGQVSNFNLDSADRIEVLRGPFSALYGNAAGGVIQMFTADGRSDPGPRATLVHGADNVWRESIGARGGGDAIDYNVDFSHFRTDGYRDHSQALRNSFNARLKVDHAGAGSFTLLANSLAAPDALDPLGLTQSQMEQDPRQAVPAAMLFNTRKSVTHAQAGLIFERTLGPMHSLRLLAYGGTREVSQFLAVPVAAQLNPLSGGGVVELHSEFSGVDARWTIAALLASRPIELTLGIDADRQDQHRLGFENFLEGGLGVRGDLRRDQQDQVSDFDQYAQASWQAAEKLNVLLGVRHSQVRFTSADHYVTASNPDDSGRLEFSATSPIAGISFRPVESLDLYAAYGHGFETPTFDELSYRPDGSAGLNFLLQATHTRSLELGAKARVRDCANLELALFRADSDDELAVASNSAGRATYQNVGRARRHGLEFSADARLGEHWHGQLSWTLVDASFRDDFVTCGTSACANPQVPVSAGTQIPGVPRQAIFVSAQWQGSQGWEGGLAAQTMDSLSVDNVGDARAHPYTVVDANAGYRLHAGGHEFHGYFRIGNILARRYAGSVIINETNGRYFEPAPGRSFLMGADLRW